MRRPAALQGILVLAAFQAVRHTALEIVHSSHLVRHQPLRRL